MIELEYRLAGIAGEIPGPWTPGPAAQEGREIFIAGLVDGVLYEARARAISPAGTKGDWFYSAPAKASRGENIDGFGNPVVVAAPRELRIEDDDCLHWDPAPGATGYEVRHAAGDFAFPDAAVDAASGLVTASPFPLCSVPRGERTILVRAVLLNGQMSVPAVLLVDRGPFDEALEVPIESHNEHTAWTGDAVGFTLGGGELTQDLEDAIFGEDGAPFFGDDAEDFFIDRGSRATYEFVVNPAASVTPWDGRILTLDVDIDAENWRAEYRIGVTDEFFDGLDDDPFFGDDAAPFFDEGWKPWPGKLAIRDTTAITIRIVIPAGCRVAGVLSELTWRISRPPTLADAAAASTATTVAYAAPLRLPTAVVAGDLLVAANTATIFDTNSVLRVAQLPAAPADGDAVWLKRWGTHDLEIDRNGHDVDGVGVDPTLTTDGDAVTLRYDTGTGSWWTWRG